MNLSLMLPGIPYRLDDTKPSAKLVADGVAARLWQGFSLGIDTFQNFAALSAAGLSVPAGVGVTLMPATHPYYLAAQAASLTFQSGLPFVLGIGPGPRAFQRAMLGEPYANPLEEVRKYVRVVRSLVTTGGASIESTVGNRLVTHSVKMELPSACVATGVGVLRPGMARLAGAEADCAITWLTPADYIADVLSPSIEAGAHQAQRGSMPKVIAMVPMALATQHASAARIAFASSYRHLAAPHYQAMLRAAGVDVKSTPLGTASSIVDSGAFLHGSLDQLLESISRFDAVGVDEVVINVTGVAAVLGATAAHEQAQQILEAARATGMGGTNHNNLIGAVQ